MFAQPSQVTQPRVFLPAQAHFFGAAAWQQN